jgi:ATP-dependent exoDNAse (exonuclease V) beta subunit
MSDVRFTPAQLDAVNVDLRHLDACVVAGPGSGKTTVLVEYFKRLVEAGVDPLRILAITFTEKAAANMRKKLGQAFQQKAELRARMERAWVSTVHGFCARLLKENAVFAGIDPEFGIADERRSWRLQQESVKAAIDGLLEERLEDMRALIRALSTYEFERVLLVAYDAMRGAGTTVDDLSRVPAPPGITRCEIGETLDALRQENWSIWNYQQKEQMESALEGARRIVAAETPQAALGAVEAFQCNLSKCKRGNNAYNLLSRMKKQIEESRYALITELYTPERELLLEILRRFDRIYRERKRSAGLVDFADLEEFTVRLLEQHEEARARVRRQFDHVLMDEFQDTNGQQAKLMQLLRPADRFYAVGDINQSIYGFRHADPAGFREYRDEIVERGRRLVELTGNFRSRAQILSAVETITDGLPGIEQRPLVAGREFQDEVECCMEVIAAPQPDVEAAWVARRIVEMSEFSFKDFAVLVRNTEVIGEFTAAFDMAGIPYVVNRGRGFYESREVNDLTHLLRVIANPRDEVSMAVVLRSPLVGVGEEELLRLKSEGGNLGMAVMHCADDSPVARFRDRLREWRSRREYCTFDRLLLAAMDDCGYPAAPNLDKFLAQTRDAAAGGSLDAYIQELELVREENPREPDAPPEDSLNAVKVMTVHSAKGLEFPVVFVAALHKGVDSKPPSVAFSRRYGLGARWRNPATGEDSSDLFLHALNEEWKRRELEEANRLLYVAMTRAEQRLVLSFSATSRKPSQWDKTVVERLLLDVSAPGEEMVVESAPDGKAWKLRVRVAEAAPELAKAPRAAEPEQDVQYLTAPIPDGQQNTNATVTALAQFANCPREYYLAQYLGYEGRKRRLEREEEDGELSAGDFGTQVHALLAGKPVPTPDAEAVRLAEVFRQSPLGKRSARAARAEREFDFLMALDDLVVRGQVDLWFEEGGELVVVDYKTDAVTAAEAHHRARDYAMQLRLYAMAVERLAGRPPSRAWLHFLRPDTLVEVDLSPSLLESPEHLVRDFQEAQSKLEFPLNEGPRCRTCPFFRDLCPAGRGQPAGPEPIQIT